MLQDCTVFFTFKIMANNSTIDFYWLNYVFTFHTSALARGSLKQRQKSRGVIACYRLPCDDTGCKNI